jgi:hypothetical protein
VTGRIVILAHPHDNGAAAWAATAAARLGSEAVTVLRPEALGLARWSHRIDSQGRAATRLTTPGGDTLDSSAILCLLNRLQYLPSARFQRAPPKDRDYAAAELQALVASWLSGLGDRVVNRAGPHGLAVGPASQYAWLALAATAGLPVSRRIMATSGGLVGRLYPGEHLRLRAPWPAGPRGPMPVEVSADDALDPAGTVLVAGEEVVGTLAVSVGAACRAVARRCGCLLLEFRFCASAGAAALLAVDPLPALGQPWEVAATARLVEAVATDRAGAG